MAKLLTEGLGNAAIKLFTMRFDGFEGAMLPEIMRPCFPLARKEPIAQHASVPDSPVIRTLAELIRINSVNPAYEGGPGELIGICFLDAAWFRRSVFGKEWAHYILYRRDKVIRWLS